VPGAKEKTKANFDKWNKSVINLSGRNIAIDTKIPSEQTTISFIEKLNSQRSVVLLCFNKL
jgi:hypothetical protein